MGTLQWFRLYHRMVDDDRMRLLAFEDRWHFVALCCLKGAGLLDAPDHPLKLQRIAVKMGLKPGELDEVKRRLCDVGLIDEQLQPLAWNELQYKSDSSSERVRKFRARTAAKARNVSVTAQETDKESEAESESTNSHVALELEDVLGAEHASAVHAHRKGLKKPLTAHAARLLARSLAACANPQAAADLMIERGWASIKPDWVANAERCTARPQPAQLGASDVLPDLAQTVRQLTGTQQQEDQSHDKTTTTHKGAGQQFGDKPATIDGDAIE